MPTETTDVGPDVRRALIRPLGYTGTLAAVSGGRVRPTPLGVSLPCGYGYHVEIDYNVGPDAYTVRRVFIRRGERFVKGEVSHVYVDALPETVYRAGMFRDPWPAGGAK